MTCRGLPCGHVVWEAGMGQRVLHYALHSLMSGTWHTGGLWQGKVLTLWGQGPHFAGYGVLSFRHSDWHIIGVYSTFVRLMSELKI